MSERLTVDRFCELFASDTFDENTLSRLDPYYADDVVFIDPIQTVRGRAAFMAMNRRLMARARSIRFDVVDRAQDGDQLFVTWVMTMRPKMPSPTLRIEGVTHCILRDGLITVHRDYWDLLSAVMDTIPIVGGLYRRAIALIG